MKDKKTKQDIIKEITIAHLTTEGGTAEKELYRLIITGIPIKEVPNYDKLNYFDIHTPDDTSSFCYCYQFYNKLSASVKQYVLNRVKVDAFWYFIVSNIDTIYAFGGEKIYDLMHLITDLHTYYLYGRVHIIVEDFFIWEKNRQEHALSANEVLKLERTSGYCCYNFTDDAKKFLVERAKTRFTTFCDENGLNNGFIICQQCCQ